MVPHPQRMAVSTFISTADKLRATIEVGVEPTEQNATKKRTLTYLIISISHMAENDVMRDAALP